MIISVSGLIGAGKDTVADYLVGQHGFKRESFASTLKDAVSSIFGWDRVMLEGRTKEVRDERELIDKWWAERLGIPHLSPRWVLQYFGTDTCRKHFNDDIWLASLENKLRQLSPDDNIVISDSRFMNELNMLRQSGSKMVTIYRGPFPDWWETAQIAQTDSSAMDYMLNDSGVHRSEWDWAGFEFDNIIENNGSLSALNYSVDNLLH